MNIGASQAIVGSGATPGVAALTQNSSGTSALNFNMNGYSETFGVLKLTNGTLDFNLAGSGTDLAFADSSATAWGLSTATALNFTNFDPTSEIISFGNSASALTTAQLQDITLDGQAALINSVGDLYLAPEPSAWTMMIIGVFGLLGVHGPGPAQVVGVGSQRIVPRGQKRAALGSGSFFCR